MQSADRNPDRSLIQLANGDWIQPADVRQVRFHTREPAGGSANVFIPDRVNVHMADGSVIVMQFGIAEAARQYRDELARRCNQPRLAVVEAGVDPAHQTNHCDHCGVVFLEAGVEWTPTCDAAGPLTLCRPCYRKAGNSVR